MAQAGALDLSNPKTVAQRKDEEKKSFGVLIRAKVSSVLVGKKADDFVTSLISLMNQDLALKTCDVTSLVAAALQAQSLNLSLNRQLGQAWIVPFNDNKNKRVLATFQIGYKGYIQLAIRSGYYRKINVLAIKEGELKGYDPLNEELDVDLIQDALERLNAPSIGYYAMFEYLNGFRKCMYWPRQLMEVHAVKYSPAFRKDREKGWTTSFWSKDFDAMAYKTMLRQLLTKWGIMSVEMQQAYDTDTRVFQENGDMGGFMEGDMGDDGQPVYEGEVVDPDGQEDAPQKPDPDPAASKPGKKQPQNEGQKSAPEAQDTAPKEQDKEPEQAQAVPAKIHCPIDGYEVGTAQCDTCPERRDCKAWKKQ